MSTPSLPPSGSSAHPVPTSNADLPDKSSSSHTPSDPKSTTKDQSSDSVDLKDSSSHAPDPSTRRRQIFPNLPDLISNPFNNPSSSPSIGDNPDPNSNSPPNSPSPSPSSSPSKNPTPADPSSNQSSGSNPSLNPNQPSDSPLPSPTNSPTLSNPTLSPPGNSTSASPDNSPSPLQSTAAASASPSPVRDSTSPLAPTPLPSPSPNSNNGQKNGNGQKNNNSPKPDNHHNNNNSGNNINTITSTYDAPAGQPSVNAQRNIAAPSSSPQPDTSSGLSSGAITAIAVIAGIIGFILLFWVGVQMLQSKRRRREEAEMQEIDFGPNGNGSINGDNPFPRPSAALERQPSSFNGSSLGYSKGAPAHYGEPMYADDMRIREEAEYVDPHANSEYDSNLQRQPTVGTSSAYTGSAISSQASLQPYYSNGIPRQHAPYTNYTPYAGQYGALPLPPPAQNFDYGHRRFDSNNGPSTIEYHHYGESRDGPGHSKIL